MGRTTTAPGDRTYDRSNISRYSDHFTEEELLKEIREEIWGENAAYEIATLEELLEEFGMTGYTNPKGA